MKIVLRCIVAVTLAVLASNAMAGGAQGVPGELKGFQGMMKGELVKKSDEGLDFKVKEIVKVWRGNKADKPKKAIGKVVRLKLDRLSRNNRSSIMVNYARMEKGDLIELEAFDLGGTHLFIKEMLRKVEAEEDDPWEGQGDNDGDAEKKEDGEDASGEVPAPGNGQRSGKTTGQVLSSGDVLRIATEGEEETFKVMMLRRRGRWVRDESCSVALKKTLKPGMTVTVSWSIAEGGAKCINGLSAGGSVEGMVVGPAEKGVLRVQVEGVSEPMRFVSRWIQKKGKWIPGPKDVALIRSVETGQKVKVTYVLEEHLRINELEVVASEDGDDEASE